VRPAHVSVEECTRRFIEVQEAYEVLSDPQRRAVYDFEMMHGRQRGGGHPHARATWRPRQRDGEPLWDSPQDEVRVPGLPLPALPAYLPPAWSTGPLRCWRGPAGSRMARPAGHW